MKKFIESLDKNDSGGLWGSDDSPWPAFADWYWGLRRSLSLCLSEGHRNAEHYSLGRLHDEAALIQERVNGQTDQLKTNELLKTCSLFPLCPRRLALELSKQVKTAQHNRRDHTRGCLNRGPRWHRDAETRESERKMKHAKVADQTSPRCPQREMLRRHEKEKAGPSWRGEIRERLGLGVGAAIGKSSTRRSTSAAGTEAVCNQSRQGSRVSLPLGSEDGEHADGEGQSIRHAPQPGSLRDRAVHCQDGRGHTQARPAEGIGRQGKDRPERACSSPDGSRPAVGADGCSRPRHRFRLRIRPASQLGTKSFRSRWSAYGIPVSHVADPVPKPASAVSPPRRRVLRLT